MKKEGNITCIPNFLPAYAAISVLQRKGFQKGRQKRT